MPDPSLPSASRATSFRVTAILILASALLLAGWLAGGTWFVCDDAYIAFRYAANWRAGRGIVWNPPPFRPVEGYTSFAWVVLVGGGWRLTGVAPPVLAPALGLFFAAATLGRLWWHGLRMRLPAPQEETRLGLVALMLGAVAANRTFLAWATSGLETPLFALALLGWTLAMARPLGDEDRLWSARVSAWASVLALTRPDGYLFVAATLALAVPMGRRARTGSSTGSQWLGFLALLPVAAHVLWRRSFYGAWLPNTYVAKHVDAWPEAGARYALAFALEYFLWPLLVLIAWWLWSEWRRLRSGQGGLPAWEEHAPKLLGGATLTAHLAYYVLSVGGDHFEYRIFAAYVPLMMLGGLHGAAALREARRSVLALGVATLVTLPLPWLLWEVERYSGDYWTIRSETPSLASLPAPARPFLRPWAQLQDWLLPRGNGIRVWEHRRFIEMVDSELLAPERAAAMEWEPYHPVVVASGVGIVGWTYPNVAVIDTRGLNDLVIARTEWANRGERYMAHDRRPPEGYVECFAPNVDPRHAMMMPRKLSSEAIIECETRDWPRVSHAPK